MRDGGDILTLGRNLDAAMRKITANLPIGIETTLVANQAVVVDDAIREFLESLWQAIAIIMVVSFIALGVRPGTVVALSIPLTIGLTFPVMELVHIDLQRISLGALIIALSLLVDDAMTTIDVMESRLAEGDEKETAATYAYRTLAAAMLTGSFITATGFVPIGFARSSAGEYTFSIFVVVGLTLMLSWLVAVLFAPLLGVWMLKKPEGKVTTEPSRLMCVESHLRELIEQGFEVAVAKDATAAPKHPTWGYGYTAALINYAYLAHAVLRTDKIVHAMKQG